MKRTPWFHTDVLPVRAGVYEWRCLVTNGHIRHAVFHPVIKWDGTSQKTNCRPSLACKHCMWRGLTKPAKEQK